MLNGEWLYERLRIYLSGGSVVLPPWAHCTQQGAYETTMREAVYLIAMLGATFDPNPAIDWRDYLRKYGRHAPTCATTGSCTCGFADVEKLLT